MKRCSDKVFERKKNKYIFRDHSNCIQIVAWISLDVYACAEDRMVHFVHSAVLVQGLVRSSGLPFRLEPRQIQEKLLTHSFYSRDTLEL